MCIYTYIVRNWRTPSWKLNSDLQSCSLSQDPSRKDRLLSLETGRKRQSFLTQPVILGMPTTDWARAIHPGEASVLNSVCWLKCPSYPDVSFYHENAQGNVWVHVGTLWPSHVIHGMKVTLGRKSIHIQGADDWQAGSLWSKGHHHTPSSTLPSLSCFSRITAWESSELKQCSPVEAIGHDLTP